MALEPSDEVLVTSRISCQFCDRKFNPESISKHSAVCEKVQSKKRNTFDSAKQRIQGITDAIDFVSIGTVSLTKEPTKKARMNPIKKNKNVRGSEVLADISQSTVKKAPSRLLSQVQQEQCPYCGRSFGLQAFERHFEFCKKKSTGHNYVQINPEAKERLEARVKYRAPSFRSRRSLTREKYSPKGGISSAVSYDNLDRDGEDEIPKHFGVRRSLSNSRSRSRDSLSNGYKENCNPVNFIRQNVLRCSYKNRLPIKNNALTSKKQSEARNGDIDVYYDQQQRETSYNSENYRDAREDHKLISTVGMHIVPSKRVYENNHSYDPFRAAEMQMKSLNEAGIAVKGRDLNDEGFQSQLFEYAAHGSDGSSNVDLSLSNLSLYSSVGSVDASQGYGHVAPPNSVANRSVKLEQLMIYGGKENGCVAAEETFAESVDGFDKMLELSKNEARRCSSQSSAASSDGFSSTSSRSAGSGSRKSLNANGGGNIFAPNGVEDESRQSVGSKTSWDSAYNSLSRSHLSFEESGHPSTNLEKKNVDDGQFELMESRERWSPEETQRCHRIELQQRRSLEDNQRFQPTETRGRRSLDESRRSKPVGMSKLRANEDNSIPRIKAIAKFCHECGSPYPVSVMAKYCCECGTRRHML